VDRWKEGKVKGLVLSVVALAMLACASAPKPKAPDESRRTPVNKVVPPELAKQRP
jgi:hypothetical protein